MFYQIGDTVTFKDEVGYGVITKIKPPNKLWVEVDGLEYPCLEEDVIKIATKEPPTSTVLVSPYPHFDLLTDSIYWLLMPSKQHKKYNYEYSMLINTTDKEFFVSLCYANKSLLAEKIQPNSHFSMKHFNLGADPNASVIMQVLTLKNTSTIPHPLHKKYADHELKLFNKELLQTIQGIEQPARLVKLHQFTTIIENPSVNPIPTLKKIPSSIVTNIALPEYYTLHKSRECLEVDLHLPNLVDSIQGLDKSDRIELQLSTFREAMNHSFRLKLKKIILIHGIGKGILKSAIWKELATYDTIDFYDAPYKEYGAGATEVKIWYK